VLGDTLDVLSGVTGQRRPVAVLTGDGDKMLMVFPSVSCANTVIGETRRVPRKEVSISIYKSSIMQPAECIAAIRWLRGL
jgi:hypothetical protein